MNWKRWIIQIIGFALVTVAVLGGVVNFIVDPYDEWNFSARLKGNKFFQLHETAPFRFARLLEEQPYTLVFGTSHSSTISEELIGGPVLNLSVSVYGNPIDIIAFLRLLSPRALGNIKQVFYDIDYLSLGDKESLYRDLSLSPPYLFWKTLETLTPQKVQRALYTVYANKTNSYTSYIKPNGVFVYRREIDFDPNSAEARTLLTQPTRYRSDPQAVAALRELVAFLNERRIPAIYFNTIFSMPFLRNTDLGSLQNYLKAVASVVPEFTSLLYVPGISEDLKNFRDPSHHKYVVTKREFELLRQSPQRYTLTQKSEPAYTLWLMERIR